MCSRFENNFLKDLARLQVEVRKVNKLTRQTLTYEESVYITNFLLQRDHGQPWFTAGLGSHPLLYHS
ncbi:hypothetical protein GJ744_000792 [Endocarpon pusillum]|uniref:Uncharacterized protein n=1 Tax=Endocarpon pusillum TaxID=364733 RepID=A0A8H7EAC1_9EURO|nr:hypothetical protein GJ744_000792 [Endocarpon pusillum]